MKKLGDSLLSRSSKVTEMITQLESAVSAKDDGSPDKRRVNKSLGSDMNTFPVWVCWWCKLVSAEFT